MKGLICGIKRQGSCWKKEEELWREEKGDKWMKRWGADEYTPAFHCGCYFKFGAPSRLNDTCLKLFHLFTQYKNSISQQRLSPTCQEVIHSSTAGKERVNSFGSWNVIQVIVSATELAQVSFKRLLNTHRGNNVVRSNCWAKSNCEIFRSEKNMITFVDLNILILKLPVYPWRLLCWCSVKRTSKAPHWCQRCHVTKSESKNFRYHRMEVWRIALFLKSNKVDTVFRLHVFIHGYSLYIWRKCVQVQRTWQPMWPLRQRSKKTKVWETQRGNGNEGRRRKMKFILNEWTMTVFLQNTV